VGVLPVERYEGPHPPSPSVGIDQDRLLRSEYDRPPPLSNSWMATIEDERDNQRDPTKVYQAEGPL
jgi:hypothetical protein